MDKRITVRFNDREAAELEYFKKTFHIDKDSEALKTALNWCNHYIKNVTSTFFPPSHDVILMRKTKTGKMNRKVFD